ncbi:MAG: alanine racemase [Candidatus Nomurabacteria bacterium]|nr:alanine racemase [Candidatus Nomurabacteria bacterium]
MKNNYLSHIEISKENLIHNIKQFRSLVKKETQIISAIKANAYGHGQKEVIDILASYTDAFMINSFEELEMLRKQTKKKTFVLGYVMESDLAKAMKLDCVLSVFSREHLLNISAIGKKLNKVQEVHLAVDAHLGREGVLFTELPEIFTEIKKSKYIKLTGIYAHFANIEDTTDFSHANKQIATHRMAVNLAKEYGFKNLQTHISATSGVMAYEIKENAHPLVRIGIGLYGLWPSEELKNTFKKIHPKFNLLPVLSWKTKIAQVKTLSKGSTVGYGLTYKTKKETKVAVIPQGYADGLDRRLSNKGEVLIGGTRCKILGRVMMNMFVVDVNHLKDLCAEDKVVIIGKQNKLEITAEDLAEKIGTINYEVVAHLSALLPRVVI